jgi:hypothetical protein
MTTFTELLELFIDAWEQFNHCTGRSERVQAELLDRYDATKKALQDAFDKGHAAQNAR